MGFVTKRRNSAAVDLTNGPIAKGMISFAVPVFLGQLLQQFYNMADAWVIGNFADNNAFAAVSSAGSLIFLITGFFSGIAIGGGVIISKYVGADNKELISRSIPIFYLEFWRQWELPLSDFYWYRSFLYG